jgi:formate hydrogenlyase subunit 3/multisubunit Na+/H+ antiporter MnhD subunit
MIEFPMEFLFIAGLLCLLIPQRLKLLTKAVALAASSFALVLELFNLFRPFTLSHTGFFTYTNFSGLIGLGCAFFCFIVVFYSLKYADSFEKLNQYYGFILWCTGFSLFAAYSSSLITLTIFWGLSGLMLYLLANLTPHASNTAKKSFIFLGGSDALMILGVAIYGMTAGSFDIYGGASRLPLSGAPTGVIVSFLCLSAAALTKAGAMPFHTWIPDFAQDVPMSLTAFLPASVDKLLGIFLLTLICHQLFILNVSMTVLLLFIGSFTVISAVYMAMAQHDMKKLLAYHAVSQVGYMVIGIASGTAIGIAGGVFHMVNHAIYKSSLFLSGGAVEHRTGTTDLNKLGGLSKYMPGTFAVCLIAALSISGIPPLNGFVSKWMVFQGLFQQVINLELVPGLRLAFLAALAVAMFGSALTLASFVKLLHSVFLGQPSEEVVAARGKIKEVGFSMLFPMSILAFLCVLFGVAAYSIPLKGLILPALFGFGVYFEPIQNLLQPGPALVIVLAGSALGLLIYLASRLSARKDTAFAGSEDLPVEARFEGTEFYKSVTEIGIFKWIYRLAEKKYFDIYNLSTKFVLGLGGVLSELHTGSIRTYILWFLLGFAVIFYVLARSL